MKKRISFKKLKNNLHIYSSIESEIPQTSSTDSEKQVDLVSIVKLCLSNIKFLAFSVILFMVVTSIVVYIMPNKYTSEASILPTSNSSRVLALQELSRFNLGGFDLQENSSTLFPTILKSNTVVDIVLNTKYTFGNHSHQSQQTYQEYLDIKTLDVARKKIRKELNIGMNKKTGVISLAIDSHYPELSQAVLRTFLDELNRFNTQKRQSNAKNNVEYLEGELAEKEDELHNAEDSLETFQKVNRNWASTTNPEILKALSRHKRSVRDELNTYVFLRKQYEISKLDVQKDIPVVSILDQPSLATIKSSPHRLSTILLSGIVAFFLSIVVIICIDAYRKSGLYQYTFPENIRQRNKSIFPEAKV